MARKEINNFDVFLSFILIFAALNWLPIFLKNVGKFFSNNIVINYDWDLVALIANSTYPWVGLVLYLLMVISGIWWFAIIIDMLTNKD